MFGARYFGRRQFGARFFGDGGTASDGCYFGGRYFGARAFGARYFGTSAPASTPGDGCYFGGKYFGARAFGPRYFGTAAPSSAPGDGCYFGGKYFGSRHYGARYFGGTPSSPTTETVGRPVSDSSNSGWIPSAGVDLYAMLDEVTPSDADYIYATTAGAICELPLNDTTWPGGTTQKISFKGWSSSGQSVKVELINTADAAVVRSITQALTTTSTQYDVTLTAGEVALITSGALKVKLTSL